MSKKHPSSHFGFLQNGGNKCCKQQLLAHKQIRTFERSCVYGTVDALMRESVASLRKAARVSCIIATAQRDVVGSGILLRG